MNETYALSAKREAINLSNLLKLTLGEERFPVDVKLIAKERSKNEADPITLIKGDKLDGFEGALYPSPSGKPEWAILYNSSIREAGRVRFTLAHELGHYILHRSVLDPVAIQCDRRDMTRWSDGDLIEAEANEFASYLLMPLDDYRVQVGNAQMTFDLARHCGDRYGVSLTAVLLKWVEFTDAAVVLVASDKGEIAWSKSSAKAFKRGIFFRKGSRLPECSVAAIGAGSIFDSGDVAELPKGVWHANSAAREWSVFSKRYNDLSLVEFL
ncbi:ImmA/IrrE family metallo-endopeptidase [Thalassospiraceae bacterium LMO-JJ14]|nr:ImmA/IrrE family metallo-endopeptidase [Thalassospiraceae bacterium LMO-JJ14]